MARAVGERSVIGHFFDQSEFELLRFDAVFEDPPSYITKLIGSNQPLYLNSNELIGFNK